MAQELPEQHYGYVAPSTSVRSDGALDLRLSTSGGPDPHPRFFAGEVLHARQNARMLQAVARVARTRFYTPPAMIAAELLALDPVVTASEDTLRFESLSSCAGVYARVDLLPDSLEGAFVGRGTTNVDFNAEMRAALGSMTDDQRMRLSVGGGGLELETGSRRVVERKVPLPARWIKSFAEVALAQADMEPRYDVGASQARRFLRSVPASPTRGVRFWVVPTASGLRLSRGEASGAVAIAGADRLRGLAELARHARRLRVYGNRQGSSAWELVLDGASFHLVLSPEGSRGFSGEGGVLSSLADPESERAATRIRGELRSQPCIDTRALADATLLSEAEVLAGLAALGAGGIVGYDLRLGAYFHRELPLDMGSLAAMHPRLRDARKLVEAGAVRLARSSKEQTQALVASGGVEHSVRLEPDGARCSCPWYARHRGERGPCKHVLATQILAADRAAAPSSA